MLDCSLPRIKHSGQHVRLDANQDELSHRVQVKHVLSGLVVRPMMMAADGADVIPADPGELVHVLGLVYQTVGVPECVRRARRRPEAVGALADRVLGQVPDARYDLLRPVPTFIRHHVQQRISNVPLPIAGGAFVDVDEVRNKVRLRHRIMVRHPGARYVDQQAVMLHALGVEVLGDARL